VRTILLIVSALFAVPAAYLLAIVYTAAPVTAAITERTLDVRLGSTRRGGKTLIYDMELRFRTAAGQDLSWKQQLPFSHEEEALMLFDDYPPGKTVQIFQHKGDAVLKRGLPDWRFGLGLGLGIFALGFLFFAFVSDGMSLNGPWLLRPQRIFALMGLAPLIGGVLFYQSLQAKINSWPRVKAVVVKAPALSVFDSRAPGFRVDADARAYLKDAELDSIHYTYQGREYLFSGDADVYAYSNAENDSYELIVDPANPAELSEIPGDDKFTGAYVLLGFGAVFVLLGLFIP